MSSISFGQLSCLSPFNGKHFWLNFTDKMIIMLTNLQWSSVSANWIKSHEIKLLYLDLLKVTCYIPYIWIWRKKRNPQNIHPGGYNDRSCRSQNTDAHARLLMFNACAYFVSFIDLMCLIESKTSKRKIQINT